MSKVLTVDEIVEQLITGISPRLFLLFFLATTNCWNSAIRTYLVIFTGVIPYTEWRCINEDRCGHINASTEYNLCGMGDGGAGELVHGVDFLWNTTRTSFAIEWDLYCGREYLVTITSSMFFVGATFGLLTSTAIYDKFGRKNGSLLGSLISFVATVACMFGVRYEMLIALRLVQGFGQLICWTGVYCWLLEFAPGHLRNPCNGAILLQWAVGYTLLVGASFLLHNWRYIFLMAAVVNFATGAVLVVFPESPRFLLVRGQETKAVEVLEWFARTIRSPLDMATIQLTYEKRVQSFTEQVRDFGKYARMRKETVLCITMWFLVATLFYGFSFSWTKITSDLYLGYLMAAMAMILAVFIFTPVNRLIGRKKALMVFLVCAVAMDLVAMVDHEFSPGWDVNRVACLAGNVALCCCYGTIYLYTGELAPTSHRGMIMALCSSAARVGSTLGPYMTLLYRLADRRIPLGVFGALTILCGVAVWGLSDTTGRRIPETPKDVEVLAGYTPVPTRTKGEEKV